MSDAIKVDIWSDIACPWCYLGQARLDRVVESGNHDELISLGGSYASLWRLQTGERALTTVAIPVTTF